MGINKESFNLEKLYCCRSLIPTLNSGYTFQNFMSFKNALKLNKMPDIKFDGNYIYLNNLWYTNYIMPKKQESKYGYKTLFKTFYKTGGIYWSTFIYINDEYAKRYFNLKIQAACDSTFTDYNIRNDYLRLDTSVDMIINVDIENVTVEYHSIS